MVGFGAAKLVFVPVVLVIGLLIGAWHTPTQNSQTKTERPNPQEETEGSEQKDFKPLFVGWEKPTVALMFSGRQNGYIEPCGCTGLDNQKGGIMRRHTFLKQLREEKQWTTLAIDSGNQIRRFGRQANLKIATTYQAMGEDMNYSVIGLGPSDLRISPLELYQVMRNAGFANPQDVFTCANVTVQDAKDTSRYRILDQNGLRIGVTMVLGDEHVGSVPKSGEIQAVSVTRGLYEVIPLMQKEKCDFNVLLAFTSLERARQLAQNYDAFDAIITGVDGEPTSTPEAVRSSRSRHITQLVQIGEKGMYVAVIGLYKNGESVEMSYQRVPMDARFEDSEAIKDKFLTYQTQLRALGLEQLQVRAIAHPTGRQFVGSDACYDCHESAFDVWKDGIDGNGGPHARATLDLTDPGERTWVQRHYDPECISCHVTGWNPQEFYPYESGYLKLDDKLLHGNGCENCHGPGSMHVAAENGDIDVSVERAEELAQEMVVTLEEARNEMCATCHDLDNSPDFHLEGAFEKYWNQIKHYEDDE